MAIGKKAVLSISLAVAIVGGGSYAAYSFMNSDTDIATVVPANAAAFVNLDSSPSLKQGKSALDFIDKVNKALPEQDKDDKFQITGEHFEGLDEKAMIESWVGDKIAWVVPENAMNKDSIKSIDDVAKNTAQQIEGIDSDAVDSSNSDVKSITIYEVKNNGKAQEAIDAMKGKNSFFYVIEGKFMYVADSEGTYTKYQADLKNGSMANLETYKQDKKLIKDNVGYAWADFGKIYGMTNGNPISETKLDVEGRGISSISFENDGMTVDTKFIDITVNGEKSKKIENKKHGSESLEALPANTLIGFGVSDLSKSIEEGWDDMVKQEPSITEYATMAENYMGLKIPSELGKILGDNTAIGMDAGEKISIIAANSDKAVTDDVINKLSEGNPEDVTVTQKDKFVIVGNAGEFSDTLGTLPLFKSVMPDAASADFSLFANISDLADARKSGFEDAGMDSTGKGDVAKNLGAVGVTGAHDYDKNVTSIKVRWVLP